jgi:hypothetical protein
MNCPECRAELAPDARFCIECGAPTLAAGSVTSTASTGSTVPLAAQNGPRCPACGVRNPPIAMFCVNCGRSLGEEAAVPDHQPAPARGPALADALPPPPLSISPAPDLPARPAFDRAATLPAGGSVTARRLNQPVMGGLIAGTALIGLAFLFAIDAIFPGIFVLGGVLGLMASATAGKARHGLIPLVALWGLAFLFAIDAIFPGILVLGGIIAIIAPILSRK